MSGRSVPLSSRRHRRELVGMSIEVPSWSDSAFDVMRIGMGFAVLLMTAKMQFFRPSGSPSHPVGIARIIDLGWMSSQTVARWLRYGTYLATLCYVADVLVPFALLYLSGALLLDATFRSSFGSVNHGEHLLLVVLLAQTVAVVVWNMADRFDWDFGVLLAGSQPATTAWWSVQAIVAVYLTSGVAKLVETNGGWVHRSPGLLLAARSRVDTDQQMGPGRRQLADRSAPIVAWLSDRPGVARAVFATGLLIELASPLGLLEENLLVAVGVALIALHMANGRMLGLPFIEYQLLVLAFLVVPGFLA
jgi:hypothetical protein